MDILENFMKRTEIQSVGFYGSPALTTNKNLLPSRIDTQVRVYSERRAAEGNKNVRLTWLAIMQLSCRSSTQLLGFMTSSMLQCRSSEQCRNSKQGASLFYVFQGYRKNQVQSSLIPLITVYKYFKTLVIHTKFQPTAQSAECITSPSCGSH